MVFERLSPESTAPARQAALSYLDTPDRPDDFVAVFALDQSLETIETFTNDRRKLRLAIEAATMRPGSGSAYGRIGVSVGAAPATVGVQSRGARWMWPEGHQSVLPEDLSRIAEDNFRELEQLQQGYSSINGLRAVTAALSVFQGRKTLVYFSDGLPLRSDEIRVRFDSFIQQANRANVTVYPVDTVGLRIHSQEAENARAVEQAVRSDLNAAGDEGGLGGGAAIAMAEHVLRGGSTTHVFGRLAKETGGFVIENTNDLTSGFRRIDADRRFHYLLAYTPLNTDFNDEHRRIEVKVKRRGLQVRARSGYLAVGTPSVIPTLSYETVPLQVLGKTPLPDDVPVTARVIRLPQTDRPGRVALAVRVPPNALTFRIDEGASIYRAEFTILARIKDEHGEVVRKASQPYRLSGPAAQLDAARAAEVVFFRSPDLRPGVYTAEYVVHDVLTGRSGTGTLPLTIQPDTAQALRVSDVILVERAERVPQSPRGPKNPLMIGDVLLFPLLGETIPAGQQVPIPFYVRIRPAEDYPVVSARVVLTRDGQTIIDGPLSLTAVDSDGFIHQLSRLTVGDLTAGEYALTVTVSDGASIQNRSVQFEAAESSQ